ncbi:MAG TPA: hypothetical protein VIH89_01845 [Candidatus Sulfotelmatobacter sp.]
MNKPLISSIGGLMSEKKSNRPRMTARINLKLEKNLAAYIAAAGAAGVSLLATQSAEAKVVYTATNVTGGNISIDLNNDGVTDFSIVFREEASHSIVLVVIPDVKGNAVRPHSPFGAAAGFFGVPVGAGEKFVSNTAPSYGPGVSMARDFGYGNYSSIRGPWVNTTNRYLGIRFLINGQTHYGWARLSVSKDLSPVLTGYAYETIPNKTITEGHTSGPEEAGNFAPADMLTPIQQPVTLGMLARGVEGLTIWRRSDEGVACE